MSQGINCYPNSSSHLRHQLVRIFFLCQFGKGIFGCRSHVLRRPIPPGQPGSLCLVLSSEEVLNIKYQTSFDLLRRRASKLDLRSSREAAVPWLLRDRELKNSNRQHLQRFVSYTMLARILYSESGRPRNVPGALSMPQLELQPRCFVCPGRSKSMAIISSEVCASLNLQTTRA